LSEVIIVTDKFSKLKLRMNSGNTIVLIAYGVDGIEHFSEIYRVVQK